MGIFPNALFYYEDYRLKKTLLGAESAEERNKKRDG